MLVPQRAEVGLGFVPLPLERPAGLPELRCPAVGLSESLPRLLCVRPGALLRPGRLPLPLQGLALLGGELGPVHLREVRQLPAVPLPELCVRLLQSLPAAHELLHLGLQRGDPVPVLVCHLRRHRVLQLVLLLLQQHVGPCLVGLQLRLQARGLVARGLLRLAHLLPLPIKRGLSPRELLRVPLPRLLGLVQLALQLQNRSLELLGLALLPLPLALLRRLGPALQVRDGAPLGLRQRLQLLGPGLQRLLLRPQRLRLRLAVLTALASLSERRPRRLLLFRQPPLQLVDLGLELELLLLRRRQELLLQVLHVGLGPLVSLAGLAEQILAGLEFPREAVPLRLEGSHLLAEGGLGLRVDPAGSRTLDLRPQLDRLGLRPLKLLPQTADHGVLLFGIALDHLGGCLRARRGKERLRQPRLGLRQPPRQPVALPRGLLHLCPQVRLKGLRLLRPARGHFALGLELPDLGLEVVQALLLLLHLLQSLLELVRGLLLGLRELAAPVLKRPAALHELRPLPIPLGGFRRHQLALEVAHLDQELVHPPTLLVPLALRGQDLLYLRPELLPVLVLQARKLVGQHPDRVVLLLQAALGLRGCGGFGFGPASVQSRLQPRVLLL
mmetsp:Transcript_8029/g.27581  ORF Transcript_8029/g.27581 Transcript_8029/m.27581 type:complete len:613 (+) Transcript_8029:1366-3204(+)